MSATVVAYSAHPEDTHLTIKVACSTCGSEWGWRMDTPAGNDRLEQLADSHNVEAHGHARGFARRGS